MSNRNLLILGVVAVVMVFLAAALQRRKGSVAVRDSLAGSHLIQGLDTAEIASIVVGTGDDPVRLVRQERVFAVANKSSYPAVISTINELLRSCVRIQIIEKITSDPSNHEQLEVTEEKAQSVVKFLDKEEQIVTGVVVGKTDSQTKTTYVRLVTDDEVYSIKEPPRVRGSAMDYIEKEIVNVDRDDVVKVTVTGPEGSYTLRVDDSNEDNIILEDMPEGKKLKTGDCKEVLSALSYLSCDDVKKESAQVEELKFDRRYVSELKDSTIYTFEVAKTGGKTWVRCSGEYGDKIVMMTEGELEENEAKLLARDQALDFAKRHQGWLYGIPKWKVKNLTRESAELYEEEKGDEPASANGAEEVKDEEAK